MRRAAHLAVVLALVVTRGVWASGGSEDLERANRLYVAGDYPEAALMLDGLLRGGRLDHDETAMAQYNRGNALYRAGEFVAARAAYESAALASRVLAVEAQATYNIGNCFFREAQTQVGQGNLEQAATSLESSLAAYRRSLELDPTGHDAATNLEVARMMLKGVRDELGKYGDVRKLQQEILEELKALVASQTDVIAQNETPQKNTADVEKAQEAVRTRTRALLGRYDTLLGLLERLQARTQEANPYTASRRHVALAESYEGSALAALGSGDRFGAAGPEKVARDELQKALDILTPPQKQDRTEQGDGSTKSGQPDRSPAGQEGTQGSPRPEAGSDQGAASDAAQGGQGGAAGGLESAERPEDVLGEEGELRRSRQTDMDSRGGVDRDW